MNKRMIGPGDEENKNGVPENERGKACIIFFLFFYLVF